jgi:hypothetical protein
MSVGLMVNMVRTLTLKEGFYGLLNFDLEMEKLARFVGLPSGREGRRELERRAREALVDAAAKRQHPLLMRYLIDQVPKSYVPLFLSPLSSLPSSILAPTPPLHAHSPPSQS